MGWHFKASERLASMLVPSGRDVNVKNCKRREELNNNKSTHTHTHTKEPSRQRRLQHSTTFFSNSKNIIQGGYSNTLLHGVYTSGQDVNALKGR